MTLRILVIGDEVKERAAALVAFASLEENHYCPSPDVKPPGDDPRYVLWVNSFRCVFSVTVLGGKTWRHLSISVEGGTALPHPAMAEEMARLFGFTGTLPDWSVATHTDPLCVVMAEECFPV